MNFKGHITGGSFTGLIIAFIYSSLHGFEIYGCQLFIITVCFSLFPDLDISSIPQRWFYRGLFVFLLYLSYLKAYSLATAIALIALTPIMAPHRGWTHQVGWMLLTPVLLAAFYEHTVYGPLILTHQCLHKILAHLHTHSWLVGACLAGWSTHLILDSRFVKTKYSL